MTTPPLPTERVTKLLMTFGLTTAAQECVPRFTLAGHAGAVPVLQEVLDLDAEHIAPAPKIGTKLRTEFITVRGRCAGSFSRQASRSRSSPTGTGWRRR